MKVECSVEKLCKAISQAERVVGKNLTLPILNTILVLASDKTLKLRATNLSLGVEIEIPAKIEKEGVAAIPGNILSGALNAIRDADKIALESKESNILVKTKNNEILLKTHPHDEFPTIPIISGKNWEIPASRFVEGLRSTYWSGTSSDIKPEISSVYIYPSEDKLIFVATDSFRLAEKKVLMKSITDLPSVLIPLKNVGEIIRLLDDISENLKINVTKNQISFSAPGFYLTSRLVDGLFPDYTQIIPKETKTEAIVLKQEFIDALKLANIFSDKFNQVNLIIKPKEKIFELNSRNADVGENKSKIGANLTGESAVLSFNHKYFLDCFQSIPEDSIILKLGGVGQPTLISGGGNNSFLYLIMPMNR